MLRSFEIALQFLTTFKVRLEPPPSLNEAAQSAWAFPVIGGVIGIILAVAYALLDGHLPSILCAIVVVGLWVVITGGLHLDGWTDCWDALPASVSPERRFEILKDSRLGTFGAVGLVFLLAVKVGAVAQADFRPMLLLLAPVAGRAIMLLVVFGSPHRLEGMGAIFLGELDRRMLGWVAILGLGPAILGGWQAIVAVGGAYLGALLFRRFAESRLKAINGDVIGAVCELSEALVLLIGCLRW